MKKVYQSVRVRVIFILIEITTGLCCAVCSGIHVSRPNSSVCLEVNPNDPQLLSLNGLKVTFSAASLKTLPSYLKSKDSFLLELPFQKDKLNSLMAPYVFYSSSVEVLSDFNILHPRLFLALTA